MDSAFFERDLKQTQQFYPALQALAQGVLQESTRDCIWSLLAPTDGCGKLYKQEQFPGCLNLHQVTLVLPQKSTIYKAGFKLSNPNSPVDCWATAGPTEQPSSGSGAPWYKSHNGASFSEPHADTEELVPWPCNLSLGFARQTVSSACNRLNHHNLEDDAWARLYRELQWDFYWQSSKHNGLEFTFQSLYFVPSKSRATYKE